MDSFNIFEIHEVVTLALYQRFSVSAPQIQ